MISDCKRTNPNFNSKISLTLNFNVAGWGVLATDGSDYNSDLKGHVPFANVMSYADASKGNII